MPYNKLDKAGIRISAPNMFQMNMKVSRMPMSAWNLIGDQTHVPTATAMVIPIRATTLPVNISAPV
ncbi:hypothetical protein D3C77_778150 [compost metagenome]